VEEARGMSTDIDPDKLEAALEQLQAEQARRLQARVDSGEAILWSGAPIVVGAYDEEDADRALANRPTTTPDGRPIYYDPNVISVVVTGVPRADPDEAEPQIQPPSEEGNSSPSSPEPAGSGGVSSSPPPSQPTPIYVRIITSNGNDESGDPGAISEAWYTIEDGLLTLRDSDDKYITSRAMLADDDPAVLARSLLREAEAPKDFNRPIVYPKMGLA
jgi:hypothetical protein